jgi:galactitol-specific phosphotransferase system IIB component
MEGILEINLNEALKELDIKIAMENQNVQAYGNRSNEMDLFNQVREKFIASFANKNFSLEEAKREIEKIMSVRNER